MPVTSHGHFFCKHNTTFIYSFDLLKQSTQRKLEVSRGSNGREVIGALQSLHDQSPEKRGRSPSCFFGALPPPLFRWQSLQRSPLELLGSNGNSVMVPLQPLHVQFP